VVARADHLPEVEPSPGSAPGGEARAVKVAREMPPLNAVTDVLRVRFGHRERSFLPRVGKISDRPDAAVVSSKIRVHR
jgi:hypothetical protein